MQNNNKAIKAAVLRAADWLEQNPRCHIAAFLHDRRWGGDSFCAIGRVCHEAKINIPHVTAEAISCIVENIETDDPAGLRLQLGAIVRENDTRGPNHDGKAGAIRMLRSFAEQIPE